MVTRVVRTRESHKRKLDENRRNYSSKKAKIIMMKKLATEYKRLKNNSNTNNNYYLLNSFYDEKKILFPWLKKESFRWHVRQSENNETPPDSTDESIIICTTLWTREVVPWWTEVQL